MKCPDIVHNDWKFSATSCIRYFICLTAEFDYQQIEHSFIYCNGFVINPKDFKFMQSITISYLLNKMDIP